MACGQSGSWSSATRSAWASLVCGRGGATGGGTEGRRRWSRILVMTASLVMSAMPAPAEAGDEHLGMAQGTVQAIHAEGPFEEASPRESPGADLGNAEIGATFELGVRVLLEVLLGVRRGLVVVVVKERGGERRGLGVIG